MGMKCLAQGHNTGEDQTCDLAIKSLMLWVTPDWETTSGYVVYLHVDSVNDMNQLVFGM